ncbi:hypothetical protein Hanom_Chr16g01483151 [Helianthus anomalus]
MGPSICVIAHVVLQRAVIRVLIDVHISPSSGRLTACTVTNSPPPLPEVSCRLAGVWCVMTLAEFAIHSGLYLQDEIATDVYTQSWEVVLEADTWEHARAKGRISHVDDPLYRYLISTSMAAHGHSCLWCTSTDVFFFYCLLYRRSCALAYGLAQYFASSNHRKERGFLYGNAYVTVIARSLGHLPTLTAGHKAGEDGFSDDVGDDTH